MDGDKFISTQKQADYTLTKLNDKNFFVNSVNSSIGMNVNEPLKHINDYDSNIIQKDAYKHVNDDLFKIEYKIARIEEEIKELNQQIRSAQEIHDFYTAEDLSEIKKQLEKELNSLLIFYKEISVSAKISDSIMSGIKSKFLDIKNKIINLSESMLLRFPGKLSSILEVKNSLQTLENINKSVDELIKREYIYNEAGDKYEQLSKYIVRANSIQAQISKFIK